MFLCLVRHVHSHASRLHTKWNLNNARLCSLIMLHFCGCTLSFEAVLTPQSKTKALSLIFGSFPDHGSLSIDYGWTSEDSLL